MSYGRTILNNHEEGGTLYRNYLIRDILRTGSERSGQRSGRFVQPNYLRVGHVRIVNDSLLFINLDLLYYACILI